MRTLLALYLVLFSILTSASERAEQAWQQIIYSSAKVIDVREQSEFSESHLKGAINIPYQIIGTKIMQLNLSKDQPIVVYCRSGRRSAIAQQTLRSEGFKQVFNGGGLKEMLASKPKPAPHLSP